MKKNILIIILFWSACVWSANDNDVLIEITRDSTKGITYTITSENEKVSVNTILLLLDTLNKISSGKSEERVVNIVLTKNVGINHLITARIFASKAGFKEIIFYYNDDSSGENRKVRIEFVNT